MPMAGCHKPRGKYIVTGEYVGTITEGDILWAVKRNYNLNLQDAEDMPSMSIPRKRDNKCVSVDTDMEELIAAAMRQKLCACY